MHKQLEKYLSQIEKQLAALPVEQREEELREIRSHLEMMIEENVAHGDDPDKAVAIALEKFGSAKDVGRTLMRVKRSNHVPWWRVVLASMTTFVVGFGLLILTLNIIALSGFLISLWHQAWFSYSLVLIIMFATGWVAECIAPKKGVMSIIITYCLTFGTLSLIWFIGFGTLSYPGFTGTLWFAETLMGVLSRRLIKEGTLKQKLSTF